MFEEENCVLVEDASGLMPLFSFVIISEHVWAGERRGPGCISVAAAFWVRETSAKGRVETQWREFLVDRVGQGGKGR